MYMKTFREHITNTTTEAWSGSRYIIEKNPRDKLWYVMGHVGSNQWMPISKGFKDKKKAEKWRKLQPAADKASRKTAGEV